MTRRTATKLGRMYSVELHNGQPEILKRPEILPPNSRSQLIFIHKGYIIIREVSEGQRINPDKALKRDKETGKTLGIHSFCKQLSAIFKKTIEADEENNLHIDDDKIIPAAEWVDGLTKETLEKYGLKEKTDVIGSDVESERKDIGNGVEGDGRPDTEKL